MSLKSKIEAVIYASEEPVTLAQLVGLLSEEAQMEMEDLASLQSSLPLDSGETNRDLPELNAPAADPLPEATEEEYAPNAIAESPTEAAPEAKADTEAEKRRQREGERAVREHLRRAVDELMRDYAEADRGIEVREVAGGFRMGTKPEYHDAVRGFVRSLKPALKLSLQALETLAVVAYKQPVTSAEISEIRGVDSAGVLGGLIARKLIATAGRKQVIGRPMLYKTTREFLVRFGLKDIHELPSMEEFERMAGELNEQEDLPTEPTEAVIERANARGDADHIREATAPVQEAEMEAQADASSAEDEASAADPQNDTIDFQPEIETQPTSNPQPEEAKA